MIDKQKILRLLLFIMLMSCNTHLTNYRSKISGMWTYEPDFPLGDTISSSVTDPLEPNKPIKEEFLISTDSGYYYHHYENSKFLNVNERSELWIVEFNFLTDSSGILLYYDLDTTVSYKEHPRIFAPDSKFRISGKRDNLILINEDHDFVDSARMIILENKIVLIDLNENKEVLTKFK